jgi:hypothetical protein
MASDVERLLQAGGREWKRDRRHRVYFENIAPLYGLEYDTDPQTGRLVSAKLDGAPMSTSDARVLLARLRGVKIWYDLRKKEFQWKTLPGIEKIVEKVIHAIGDALPAERAPDASRIHDYGGPFHIEASQELDAALARRDAAAMSAATAKLALVKPRPSQLSSSKAAR